MTVQRPDHGVPPDGYHYEAREAERWKWEPRRDYACRAPHCLESTIAKLDRSHDASVTRWWRYCARHISDYGKWLEDRKIMTWILVANDVS